MFKISTTNKRIFARPDSCFLREAITIPLASNLADEHLFDEDDDDDDMDQIYNKHNNCSANKRRRIGTSLPSSPVSCLPSADDFCTKLATRIASQSRSVISPELSLLDAPKKGDNDDMLKTSCSSKGDKDSDAGSKRSFFAPSEDTAVFPVSDFAVKEVTKTASSKTSAVLSLLYPLHKALCNGSGNSKLSVEQITKIIDLDPSACGKQQIVHEPKKVWCHTSNKLVWKAQALPYKYPLNIAILKKLDPKILMHLVSADPSVLTKPDGAAQEGSLAILLKHYNSQDKELRSILNYFLVANSECANFTDRLQSTPLHVACHFGAPLKVVEAVCAFSNESFLEKRNMHGDTPLDLCLKSYRYSEETMEFLIKQLTAYTARRIFL